MENNKAMSFFKHKKIRILMHKCKIDNNLVMMKELNKIQQSKNNKKHLVMACNFKTLMHQIK